MSRVAQITKSKLISIAVVLFLVGGTAVGLVQSHNTKPKATITTQNAQTTYVMYDGVEGQNALDLLKKYATIETKHYSFGDQVTSINGTAGNGPKYWSFYINGKLADVGAGSYTTKNGDRIEWKLQQL